MMVLLLLATYLALAMVLHELGHLFAARVYGVPASELGIGFGPKISGFRLGTLSFNLRALPLGSFVRLDGTALRERFAAQQLFVHLGGVMFNFGVAVLTYGTVFSWVNFWLAVGNLLPLYQQDGWKCGVVIVRSLLQRRSQPVEWAFTFSGGLLSLVIVRALLQFFV